VLTLGDAWTNSMIFISRI